MSRASHPTSTPPTHTSTPSLTQYILSHPIKLTTALLLSYVPLHWILFGRGRDSDDAKVREILRRGLEEKKKEESERRMGEVSSGSSRPKQHHIGIINQGATCYLASVLQTLYHIPHFTRRVFLIGQKNSSKYSVAGQLQCLFATLHEGKLSAASSRALLKSFGWSDQDAWEQHDIHELLTLLRDHLQKKMKHTAADRTFEQLFMGREVSYNRCVNIDHTTEENVSIFYDLQLQVKGCDSIYTAFEKYLKPMRFEGQNALTTDKYGKQDVDRHVEFRTLPPVLMLHLMRFEYVQDPMTGSLMQRKLGDRCAFPKMLKLDEFVKPDKDSMFEAPPQEYYLLSVLVHQGSTLNSGHYFAYINTSEDLSSDDSWYLFDDDKVTHVSREQAIEQNYGGTKSPYMLVYVRKSEMPKIMKHISEDEVPPFVKDRVRSESTCNIL